MPEQAQNQFDYSKERPEQKWPMQTDVFTLEKTTVQSFGVSHLHESYVENKQSIADAVRASNIVILEYAPEAQGLKTEKSREELAKALAQKPLSSYFEIPAIKGCIINKQGMSDFLDLQKSKEVVEKESKKIHDALKRGLNEITSYRQLADVVLDYMPSYRFYRGVEEECKKAGKDILLVDPDNSVTSMPEVYNKIFNTYSNTGTLELQKLGIEVVLALLGGGAFYEGVKEADKGTSRRKFLFGSGGALLGGAALTGLSSLATVKEAKSYFADTKEVGRVNNPLGQFLVTYNDFRDLQVGNALRSYAKRQSSPGVVSLFYGNNHPSGIKHYATHTKEANLKLKAIYGNMRQDVFNPPKVRLFHPTSNGWESKEVK